MLDLFFLLILIQEIFKIQPIRVVYAESGKFDFLRAIDFDISLWSVFSGDIQQKGNKVHSGYSDYAIGIKCIQL